MSHEAVQARSIFIDAVENVPSESWPAFLDEACGADKALRDKVQRLLDAHDVVDSFMDKPAAAPVSTPDQPIAERSGTQIGPYKLLEQIGEGGMGVVYVAEQLRPVTRQVALKLIKPGMDSRQVVARFEAERQALAMMDHPNIARVLDGGVTDSGRPYFVMELVKANSITDYCNKQRLSIRERLGLFTEVCHAVQHAHQKGVIHRDLKPSNILVAVRDLIPVVKVIDFGIAKAMGEPLTDKTLHTGFTQLVGTPAYMSPEQAGMSRLDIDTRSDIYSLGVLLYELLTGSTPFDFGKNGRVGHDEMCRIVRENEPPTPSSRLSTLNQADLATVADQRSVEARKLSHDVRGELDWIVIKSLDKDRNRRYETANDLASDVQRLLRDEPVQACAPLKSYRLRKFCRRNRRTLATASIVVMSLLSTAVMSTWQAFVARNSQRQALIDRDKAQLAEQKALIEGAISNAVNEFLQVDLLQQVNSAPEASRGIIGEPNLTVREALDRAAVKIDQRFQDQPLVEAAIRATIGAAYRSVAEDQRAVPHLERARALYTMHLGSEHPNTCRSIENLAETYQFAGRFLDAVGLRQKVLADRKKQLGPDNLETLKCAAQLAAAYEFAGQWETGKSILEQTLEKQCNILGSKHPVIFQTMQRLALNYMMTDQIDQAVVLYEEILEHQRSTKDPYDRILCMFGLAYAYQESRDFERAESLLREAIEYSKDRYDFQGHMSRANGLGWLARTLSLQERYAEAEPLAREAVAIFDNHQRDAWRRFYWLTLLGAVLLGQQRDDEAQPLLVKGYEGMKQRELIIPAGERLRQRAMAERIINLFEANQEPEKAEMWRNMVAGIDRLKR